MSRSKITVGIDIGTYQVRVIVAEHDGSGNPGSDTPTILGAGSAESKGLRHGYIINSSEVIKSVGVAVRAAEKASGINIKRAFTTYIVISVSNYHKKFSVWIFDTCFMRHKL